MLSKSSSYLKHLLQELFVYYLKFLLYGEKSGCLKFLGWFITITPIRVIVTINNTKKMRWQFEIIVSNLLTLCITMYSYNDLRIIYAYNNGWFVGFCCFLVHCSFVVSPKACNEVFRLLLLCFSNLVLVALWARGIGYRV